MVNRSILMFAFFFFFFVFSLYSQKKDSPEWAPPGATWWYEFGNSVSSARNCLVMESIKDTMVQNKQARIIEGSILRVNGDTVQAERLLGQGKIIIHQQGDSVFYWREDQFELVYDFSREIGDTIAITAPDILDNWREKDSVVYLYVESTGTIELNGQILRTQQLKQISSTTYNTNYFFGDFVIETIGGNLFFLPYNDLFCDAACPIPLRCYQDDSVFYKAVDIACDSTWIVSSTSLEPAPTNILLYPNPVYPGSTLHLEGVEAKEWCVQDMQGRLIAKGESIQGLRSIDIPTMVRPGMYFIRLWSDQNVYVQKIVVR